MANIIRKARKGYQTYKAAEKHYGRIRQTLDHIKKINEIYTQNNINEKIDREDYRDLVSVSREKKQKPSFPYIMMLVAFLVDVLDFLELTVIGIIIKWIIKIGFWIIFFFWAFGKVKGLWYKRIFLQLLARALIWIVIGVFISFIPFFSIFIPENVLVVWFIYNREKKAFRIMNEIFEIIHIYYKPNLK